ncbi:MAG: hypothetical protein CFE21_03115 [Bacteroidetes bacterium B1(2017)]|nr:MAG: hypothetical protein CFE21_03115 [Bacteroidetes bacterium B1(2017)]
MDAIKILVVEDEFIIARNLQAILEDLGYEPYEPVGTKKEAIHALQELEIDLAILDINLAGNQEGIEIGRYINDKIRIPFIYLTSNSDKSTIADAKETHPRAYLIKPFNEDDIYAAIEMALAYSSEPNVAQIQKDALSAVSMPTLRDSIFVKVGSKHIKVKVEDITYAAADGKMVQINTVQGQKLPVKMSLESLQELLKDQGIIRIQRGFIIQSKYISAINGEFVYILETPIPIGRQYKEDLMNQIRTIN